MKAKDYIKNYVAEHHWLGNPSGKMSQKCFENYLNQFGNFRYEDGRKDEAFERDKHRHIAGTTDMDVCATCGEDIRNPIHINQ